VWFKRYGDFTSPYGYIFTQGKLFINGHRRMVISSQKRDDVSSPQLSGEIPLPEQRDGMTRQQQKKRFVCGFL
jgi:hypothetical protein